MKSFVSIPEGDSEFKKFFAKEIQLQKDAVAAGPSFSMPALEATPLKMITAADEANKASPPEWKRRKTLD